jgi:RHS repeat-associated protein
MTGPVLTQGQSYDLEVRANGSNCTAFVDGVQIGGTQTITAHQTDTYHGLYVFQSTDHLFENFSVLAEADAEAVGWLGDPGYVTEAAVMRRLEYVRARWYQAGGPGWLSKDPIGFEGGDVDLYRYVGNMPLVAIDPSGLARPAVPLPPPGTCSWSQWRALQNAKDAACNPPDGRTCNSQTPCAKVWINVGHNVACINARVALNATCFHGGDPEHLARIEEATDVLVRCTNELNTRCRWYRPPVPVHAVVPVPVPQTGQQCRGGPVLVRLPMSNINPLVPPRIDLRPATGVGIGIIILRILYEVFRGLRNVRPVPAV